MRARNRIVRPIDTPRHTAAAVGVSRKMGEVLNRAGAQWEPRLLASLYAAAALEADDAHGRERDLVTQHHGVTRTDLAAVLGLAAAALDGRHAVPGELHTDCPRCAAALALGRVRNGLEWTAAPGDPPSGRLL
jgi:hypothetical protein